MKITLKFGFCLLAIASFTIFGGCQKKENSSNEQEVNKQVQSQFDTLIISANDTLIFNKEENKTTFIIVRHAEKETTVSNPSLTTQGKARAEKLSSILSIQKLNRIYSTVYNRTKETANPTAQNQDLPTTIYEALDHEGVVEEVFDSAGNGYVLIVGHSNTVPSFLNELTNTQNYPDLDESVYDDIFVVRGKAKGDVKVFAKKYGE